MLSVAKMSTFVIDNICFTLEIKNSSVFKKNMFTITAYTLCLQTLSLTCRIAYKTEKSVESNQKLFSTYIPSPFVFWVLLQTVKTQMKCSIMLHAFHQGLHCLLEYQNDCQGQKTSKFRKIYLRPLILHNRHMRGSRKFC